MKKRTIWLTLAILSLPLTAQQSWWPTTDQDSTQDDDNYATANLGQLKNMTLHAAEHFEDNNVEIPAEIQNMLEAWLDENNQTNNHLEANLGQLKNISTPFWSTLIDLGQKQLSDIPWTADPSDDDNTAIANIGQLKSAFNFTIESDDIDGDGIANESDPYPNDFYNRNPHTVSIISGNDQKYTIGEVGTSPVVIIVRDQAGNPLANAPVTLTTSSTPQGQFSLSPDGNNPFVNQTNVRTGEDGTVSIWYVATE